MRGYKNHKKKLQTASRALIVASLISFFAILAVALTGCTEAEKVSYNISEEADNFNVFRRVTVINARSDELILEMDGYFSIHVDNEDQQLEITCQTGEGAYAKHFVGLNEWVIYTVEDLKGAEVDPYHYEIHYLPEGNVVNFKFRESQ